MICDSDQARISKFSSLYPGIAFSESFDAVLRDAQVTGVAIATPAETHEALVRSGAVGRKGRVR